MDEMPCAGSLAYDMREQKCKDDANEKYEHRLNACYDQNEYDRCKQEHVAGDNVTQNSKQLATDVECRDTDPVLFYKRKKTFAESCYEEKAQTDNEKSHMLPKYRTPKRLLYRNNFEYGFIKSENGRGAQHEKRHFFLQ